MASVMPTLSALIPAAVGVDIGCGMAAVQMTLTVKVSSVPKLVSWLLFPVQWRLKALLIALREIQSLFASIAMVLAVLCYVLKLKKQFTLDDHIKATKGVKCRKDMDVLDEIPMTYKDIDAVMAAQSDLVDVVHTLNQVVCVKG